MNLHARQRRGDVDDMQMEQRSGLFKRYGMSCKGQVTDFKMFFLNDDQSCGHQTVR